MSASNMVLLILQKNAVQTVDETKSENLRKLKIARVLGVG
jgi:hypothetical protein